MSWNVPGWIPGAPIKSCWQLAEAAGDRTPRRMQALLA